MNLIYLVVRFRSDLPPELKNAKEAIESVLPDVKNIDKYVPRREGTIFLCSFAAISIIFDVVLYVGVENDVYCMILSAWAWGIVDCSVDFVVGIASGNMTFLDTVALSGIKQYASQLAINLDLKKRGVADSRYFTTVALAYPREDVIPQPRPVPTSGLGQPPPDAPYPVDNWIKY
ncbi:hypothetical protein IscW_ISCW010425 [Ixodes scapularis]|uniref:Uncharacterized protein n=1 Tax=Ixodes scapularis TaxID=6945 RepID=B7Q488_IXOSC|nr:hypothetical protein IscW_ISCW010425 [Ixodes scapularis]|eukprot:XP_002399967.1 hypothetical protein IscW_ISCW010425 [Ixodes scapularis]